MPGTTGMVNARPLHLFQIPFENVVIEEELAEGPRGARIRLGFQGLDIRREISALRVLFRISRHRHVEIPIFH
jgi:hypothetical protein